MEDPTSVLGHVKNDIVSRLIRSVTKAQEQGEFPADLTVEVKMETPPRHEQGDFATGVAMTLGRQMKLDGKAVAGAIVRHLDLEGSPVIRVDIAGPGFLNFFLDTSWLEKAMSRVWAEGPSYGRTGLLKGQRILLEFVSANPTGPLNVVNARAAAVGDCLAGMLEMAGAEVSREFYVNDAGNQTDVLGKSMEIRYRQSLGQEVSLPENAYRGEYLKDLAATLVTEKGDSLLSLPGDERHRFFKTYAVDKIVEWQKKTLLGYGLAFDTWFSEKTLRDSGAHNLIVELFRIKGLTYEKDGAVWFRSTEFGDDKDRVLVKSDENATATYIVPDLAYHKNKLERGYNHLIDILGPDHHGYVNRLAAGLMGLGYPKGVLEVLIVQVVRLVKGKELVKMSKRGGEFISMDELLEEVGKDAARFFFLMRSPESHLDFDIDLARLQSNENPVFYVQYAHARIASIFKQAKDEGRKFASGPNEIEFGLLRDASELALMKMIAAFPEEICEIAKAREPNRLIKYMMELSSSFHAFYTRCRVLGDDAALTSARLYLAKLAQIVLSNSLRLIGVSAPDQM